ncbi:MAG: GGDEF domain-containing protein [Rhodoferax sp.]
MLDSGRPLPLELVIDLMLDMVCVVDAQGRFVSVSAACESLLGYTPQELIGRPMLDLVAPQDLARTVAAAQRVMQGGQHLHFENRYVHKDGRLVDIMWSARGVPELGLRVAVARNITARKRAESVREAIYAMADAAHQATSEHALLMQMHLAVTEALPGQSFIVASFDATTDTWSTPYIARREPDATQGLSPAEQTRCNQAMHAATVHVWPAQGAQDGADWMGAPLITPAGRLGAVLLQRPHPAPAVTEADQDLLQYLACQIAAALERKRLIERLEDLAHHDALTKLANRRVLEDRLAHALERARRQGAGLALLYLDLDHFKAINDGLGHAAGDRLLRLAAQRLQAQVRASDTVARMSGDEFVVLLESINVPQDAHAVVQKIECAFDAPFDLDPTPVTVRPSIGLALYPEHGDSVHALLCNADDAMYRDKNSRRAVTR